jgi:hypothetical protein
MGCAEPRWADDAFASLARRLAGDAQNPTHRRELLVPESLDYSLDSLRHVDAYLFALHRAPPPEAEILQVVLRVGAYLGEVIRAERPDVFHWVVYEEAARHSMLLRETPESIATAGILWQHAESLAFPLGKVYKSLENGADESVYSFGCACVRAGR